MMPALYGERYMTINIHSLIHLPQMVRQTGPLWSNSCFPFESANGELLKLFHGTQYIDVQIMNAVNIFQSIPTISKSLEENGVLSRFSQSFLKTCTKTKIDMLMGCVGKECIVQLDDEKRRLVCCYLKTPNLKLSFYGKANIRGISYHSFEFSKSSITNSYTVKFIHEKCVCFGYIVWFARNENDHSFACILKLEDANMNLFNQNHEGIQPDEHISSNFMNICMPSTHTLKRTDTHKFCIVPLKRIVSLCVCIEKDDFIFVCEEPNHHEYNL